MKLVIVAVLAVLAVATAAPQAAKPNQPPAEIVRADFDQQPEGAYSYNSETSDGTKKQEEGVLKSVLDEENKPHEVIVVRGSYSYIDSDGNQHTVTYTADENGFQPISDDIPQPPAPARR